MVSKTTSLVIRIPRNLKSRYEDKCQEKKQIPSVVTRNLIRDYIYEVPSVRELLEQNNRRLDDIESRLSGLASA